MSFVILRPGASATGLQGFGCQILAIRLSLILLAFETPVAKMRRLSALNLQSELLESYWLLLLERSVLFTRTAFPSAHFYRMSVEASIRINRVVSNTECSADV